MNNSNELIGHKKRMNCMFFELKWMKFEIEMNEIRDWNEWNSRLRLDNK